MKIQSVAILGAGAVGSYVIWGLSQKEEIELGVIAEGERKERLQQNGCKINGKVYRPNVWTPKEACGVDLLIVALKYGALPETMESIHKAVGEHTIVMSLMNGVDSEELIAKHIGKEKLLYSLIKVASHKENDEYILIRQLRSVLFLENRHSHIRVNVSKQSESCLKIQGYIIV